MPARRRRGRRGWRPARPAATCSTCPAATGATRSHWRAPATASSASTARRRCSPRPAAAPASPRPTLVEADYRELPFADDSFDAALNLFTSLGFHGDEEDVKALAEIGRVLRPSGRLVIETMHRDLAVRGFREQDWRLLGEGRLLLEQRTFDAAAGIAQTTQTLIDKDGGRDSRTFSVRLYTATELVAMLTARRLRRRPLLRRPRRRPVRHHDAARHRRPRRCDRRAHRPLGRRRSRAPGAAGRRPGDDGAPRWRRERGEDRRAPGPLRAR